MTENTSDFMERIPFVEDPYKMKDKHGKIPASVISAEVARKMEEEPLQYRWKKEDHDKIMKRADTLKKKRKEIGNRGEVTEPHKFWKIRLKGTDSYLTPNGFSFMKGGAMVITTKKQLLRVMGDLHSFSWVGRVPPHRINSTGRTRLIVPKNIGDMEVVEFVPGASITAEQYFAPEHIEKWSWRSNENEEKNNSE